MGENEQGEMIHYTVFFMLILVLSTLLIGFIQISQVQTIQHNVEATLSKNGGYTNAAITKITGNPSNATSNQTILPINNTGWVKISKSYATDPSQWESLNGTNPSNSDGTKTHWNLTNGTVEQQNTLIPYQIIVSPIGSKGSASDILFGWIPELKFSGSAQAQVFTGNVQ